MRKLKMILKGLGWKMDSSGHTLGNLDSSTLINIEHGQPFSSEDTTKSLGMPITVEAFLMMLKRFLQSVNSGTIKTGDVYAFTMSKIVLLQLLAQEDCEKLQFLFVVPDDETKLSLAVAGRNKGDEFIHLPSLLNAADELDKQQPITKPITPIAFDVNPVLYEKVGRNSLAGILSLKDILKNKIKITDDYKLQSFVSDLSNLKKFVE